MRNDPPGLGAYLAREDRWTVCYDAANEEIRLSPHLFNKAFNVNISDKDWGELIDNGVFKDATLDGIAIERAEALERAGDNEDGPREDR